MDCTYCGEELSDDELEGPYTDKQNDIMCDECYRETQQICPICEEYYDEPKNAEETFFVLDGEYEEELEMETGVYKVLEWPYFWGAIFGPFNITKYNVKRVADYGGDDSGEICSDCYKELTEKDTLNKEIECLDM